MSTVQCEPGSCESSKMVYDAVLILTFEAAGRMLASQLLANDEVERHDLITWKVQGSDISGEINMDQLQAGDLVQIVLDRH